MPLCAPAAVTSAQNISAIPQRVLADIARLFGEPREPAIFRRASATERIKQQDAFLQRKRRLDGRSWYDIITENLDENFLGSPEDEIDPDPSGTGADQ